VECCRGRSRSLLMSELPNGLKVVMAVWVSIYLLHEYVCTLQSMPLRITRRPSSRPDPATYHPAPQARFVPLPASSSMPWTLCSISSTPITTLGLTFQYNPQTHLPAPYFSPRGPSAQQRHSQVSKKQRTSAMSLVIPTLSENIELWRSNQVESLGFGVRL